MFVFLTTSHAIPKQVSPGGRIIIRAFGCTRSGIPLSELSDDVGTSEFLLCVQIVDDGPGPGIPNTSLLFRPMYEEDGAIPGVVPPPRECTVPDVQLLQCARRRRALDQRVCVCVFRRYHRGPKLSRIVRQATPLTSTYSGRQTSRPRR